MGDHARLVTAVPLFCDKLLWFYIVGTKHTAVLKFKQSPVKYCPVIKTIQFSTFKSGIAL